MARHRSARPLAPRSGQVDIRIMGDAADVERALAALEAAGIRLDGARRYGMRGAEDGARVYAVFRTA